MGNKHKKSFNKKEAAGSTNYINEKNSEFPPCKYCGILGHPPFNCWGRPDVKCDRCTKQGHHDRISN